MLTVLKHQQKSKRMTDAERQLLVAVAQAVYRLLPEPHDQAMSGMLGELTFRTEEPPRSNLRTALRSLAAEREVEEVLGHR